MQAIYGRAKQVHARTLHACIAYSQESRLQQTEAPTQTPIIWLQPSAEGGKTS